MRYLSATSQAPVCCCPLYTASIIFYYFLLRGRLNQQCLHFSRTEAHNFSRCRFACTYKFIINRFWMHKMEEMMNFEKLRSNPISLGRRTAIENVDDINEICILCTEYTYVVDNNNNVVSFILLLPRSPCVQQCRMKRDQLYSYATIFKYATK